MIASGGRSAGAATRWKPITPAWCH